ncbi:hypothetical protein NID80_32980, partial [Paraburkholderia megapolitana]|nr:hypothetical protein [Paraburkholderia megapolitana]MDN7161813.1 hypothetical protein [Paraburkholderia sp. CHISQ3]MDQ6498861.1 hypothetical protein [Paraburkholderia megapolitana]
RPFSKTEMVRRNQAGQAHELLDTLIKPNSIHPGYVRGETSEAAADMSVEEGATLSVEHDQADNLFKHCRITRKCGKVERCAHQLLGCKERDGCCNRKAPCRLSSTRISAAFPAAQGPTI